MELLLQNPAVQGGIAPFLTALITAAALYRWPRWTPVALLVSFLTVVLLTTGIQFTPLTSTRKILIVTLLAGALGSWFVWRALRPQALLVISLVSGASAGLWVAWPILARESDTSIMAGMAVSIIVFSAAVTAIFGRGLASRSVYASLPAGVSLAFTLGGSSIVAASALLGQMGLGLGAGILALLMVMLFLIKPGGKKAGAAGALYGLVAGTTLSCLGIASVLYAKLPWYALLPMMLIPVIGMLELNRRYSDWQRAFIMLLLTMLPGLVSLYLAWDSAGDVYY